MCRSREPYRERLQSKELVRNVNRLQVANARYRKEGMLGVYISQRNPSNEERQAQLKRKTSLVASCASTWSVHAHDTRVRLGRAGAFHPGVSSSRGRRIIVQAESWTRACLGYRYPSYESGSTVWLICKGHRSAQSYCQRLGVQPRSVVFCSPSASSENRFHARRDRCPIWTLIG